MQTLEAGTQAPPFALKDTEGNTCSLAEALKQGPVLLAFFKVSCPVCQFTFPFVERLYQGVKGKNGIQVWGISQNDRPDTVAFAREYGCTFPMLLDDEGYPVSNDYGLTNVPTLFLVEPNGSISVSSLGFVRKDIEAVAEEFGQLTGQRITVFQPGDAVPDYKPG
ncbi:MAG: redoxin domain-containing protein [Acidobacteria bacterium]|nr:redoxin domain-containing protein [Acidobacteriota bacterium]